MAKFLLQNLKTVWFWVITLDSCHKHLAWSPTFAFLFAVNLHANHCALSLQVWRGALARMRYRRMKAALVILRAYRRYKVKSYIREVNKRFKNVGSMKDFGRHVKWPTPPKVLRKFEEALRSIYNRFIISTHLLPAHKRVIQKVYKLVEVMVLWPLKHSGKIIFNFG